LQPRPTQTAQAQDTK